MLVEQLLSIADDFVREYAEFNILQLLAEAIAVLERRPQLNDDQYVAQARPLRDKAEHIINASRFKRYPAAWWRELSDSELARYLPENAAEQVLLALPRKRELAAHSSELKMYLDQTRLAHSNVQSFFFLPRQYFSLRRLEIPVGQLAVIVSLPRRTFSNETTKFAKTVEELSELIAAMSELVAGARQPPTLLTVSTSDPTVILQTIVAVATPLINLYNSILDVIIKTLKVGEAFKTLSVYSDIQSLPQVPDFESRELRVSVDRIVRDHGQSVDEGRRNELSNELMLYAKQLLPAIREGARLSLATSAKEKTVTTFVGEGGKVETITKEYEITRGLEATLSRLTSDPVPQLQNSPAGKS